MRCPRVEVMMVHGSGAKFCPAGTLLAKKRPLRTVSLPLGSLTNAGRLMPRRWSSRKALTEPRRRLRSPA